MSGSWFICLLIVGQSSVASLIISSWCDGYDYMAVSKHRTEVTEPL